MKKLVRFFSSNNRASPQPNSVEENHNDNQMKAERDKQKTIRILLLGSGNAGKTTILKQMMKIHGNYHELDAQSMTNCIHEDVVYAMRILCYQSKVLHEQHDEKTLVSAELEQLRIEFSQLEPPYNWSAKIAKNIRALLADDGIQETLHKRRHYQNNDPLTDNVAYFFGRFEELAKPKYVPSFEDYLRVRKVTYGFSCPPMKLIANIDQFGQHILAFTDVGGLRPDRKKWMHFIDEDFNAVFYVIDLNAYDRKLWEDPEVNRLVDALDLFKTIVSKCKDFGDKSVVLFFNKYDLFKEKIKEVPITVAFDDFPSNEFNPNDEDLVVRFVAEKFQQVIEDQNVTMSERLRILHITALDTNHIDKVFKDIALDLVKQIMRKYGSEIM